MARKPRVHYPGAFYHVILRGNGGQSIFFDDKDRTRFYFLAQEGIERFGHRIHAFCLMTAHVHMAIQVGDVSLSRILQNLSFRYARWVNWGQSRSGHLFQGRYKAVLVDADVYLQELTRYIHLNPVRAGMVKEPVCTLGELGKVTGRDTATLSSAAKRLQIRGRKDLKLAETMKGLFKAVS